MFRYDFSKWDNEKFAKLCNSLLTEFVSEKVRPFFTVGPDAGRDADYEGSGKGDYTDWDGRWVFQYKFHDCSLLGVKRARQQIRADIKTEFQKICANTPPDNYVLLTNVPFSGVIRRGTHDWFRSLLNSFPAIKNAEVWDYTKLETLLDRTSEVRSSFFPEAEYGETFIKDVVQQVSQSVMFEAIDKLFDLTVTLKEPLEPVPKEELGKVVDLLWNIHENLSQLSSGFVTISNLMFMWPELGRLQYILSRANFENVTFKFGESIKIETKGGLIFNEVLQDELILAGPDGGTVISHRTMFSVLKRVLRECNTYSLNIHADVMQLLETYPGVARKIAGEAKKDFEGSREMSFQSNSLLAPMQYHRFTGVSDIIRALDMWVEKEPGPRSAFDADLLTSGKFYSTVELNQALQKAIKRILRNPLTLISELDG